MNDEHINMDIDQFRGAGTVFGASLIHEITHRAMDKAGWIFDKKAKIQPGLLARVKTAFGDATWDDAISNHAIEPYVVEYLQFGSIPTRTLDGYQLWAEREDAK